MNSDSRELRSTSEQVVAVSPRTKNSKRLANATENYFKSLTSEAAAEENAIARTLRFTANGLDAALRD
jgi:hypothetical protein